MRKIVYLFILAMVIGGCAATSYVTAPDIYIGMPKEELEELGFTEDILRNYHQEGNAEYMTFSDWTTPMEGDTITFYFVEGHLESWSKGKRSWAIERLDQLRGRR